MEHIDYQGSQTPGIEIYMCTEDERELSWRRVYNGDFLQGVSTETYCIVGIGERYERGVEVKKVS